MQAEEISTFFRQENLPLSLLSTRTRTPTRPYKKTRARFPNPSQESHSLGECDPGVMSLSRFSSKSLRGLLVRVECGSIVRSDLALSLVWGFGSVRVEQEVGCEILP